MSALILVMLCDVHIYSGDSIQTLATCGPSVSVTWPSFPSQKPAWSLKHIEPIVHRSKVFVHTFQSLNQQTFSHQVCFHRSPSLCEQTGLTVSGSGMVTTVGGWLKTDCQHDSFINNMRIRPDGCKLLVYIYVHVFQYETVIWIKTRLCAAAIQGSGRMNALERASTMSPTA